MMVILYFDNRCDAAEDFWDCIPGETTPYAEVWEPSYDFSQLWGEVATDIPSLDSACDALVDIGDSDYLNARQCEKLRAWISERLDRPCPERLRELYAKLDEFAARAIELGTGVVIEL